MLPTLKKLPTSHSYPENIPILLVSSDPADPPALRKILHHAHWEISQVATVKEAERHVQSSAPSVMLCERDLPDGSWKNVLRCANGLAVSPSVIVMSRRADEALWAEVLTLGGYDALTKPFDESEVARVVGMAWRYWLTRCSHLATHAVAAVAKIA